jgi:hypothetical protein
MRNSASFLLMLGLMSGLYSCKRTINCESPYIRKVVFVSSLSSMPVKDSAALVRMFNKGSGFSQLSEIFLPIALRRNGTSDRSVDIPYDGAKTYDYDWEITLLPSNRKYFLSSISHENQTSKTHYCSNGTSYVIRATGVGAFPVADSIVKRPGNPYSATPINEPDIIVEYW